VYTTTASQYDSRELRAIVKSTPKAKMKKGIYADKGYKVPNNDKVLKENSVKSRIQHKVYRNRPLTDWEIKFNNLISKQRYKVERTYGVMQRWFMAGKTKYVGIAKTLLSMF
jgi:transposase, IS5 family